LRGGELELVSVSNCEAFCLRSRVFGALLGKDLGETHWFNLWDVVVEHRLARVALPLRCVHRLAQKSRRGPPQRYLDPHHGCRCMVGHCEEGMEGESRYLAQGFLRAAVLSPSLGPACEGGGAQAGDFRGFSRPGSAWD
jgi:hypothetical protein